MKTNINTYLLLAVFALGAIFTSCENDLNTLPIDPDVTTGEKVYDSAEAYKQGLAKIYGSFILAGQEGAGGDADIAGSDPGATVYTRLLYYCQELPTDHSVLAWNDGDVQDFHNQHWTPRNGFIGFTFSRLYLTIGFANQYLRDTEEGKLLSTLTESDRNDIQRYRAEVRYLRAMAYYHGIDLFGDVPFVLETDPVGSFKPESKPRAEVFKFIEDEIAAIEPMLADPKTNEYGRVDKGAAWALLARMYLNAEVYIGEAKYTECIENCKKLFPHYSLNENFEQLFLADNHLRTNEMIFAFACDGLNSQTYGATTFIVNASIGGDYSAGDAGVNGGWNGLRVTPEFVGKFDLANDSRALFFSQGQELDIEDATNFNHGYMYIKYKNKNSDGTNGAHDTFVDTDFPMFRLADVNLMFAEAVLRGGNGGTRTEALTKLNEVRNRAYTSQTGAIDDAELTLDFILDERSRELAWECVRRTDLIRYNKFSDTDYSWAWKGGVKEGASVDAHFNLFPIPTKELNINSNLQQNAGY